MQTKLKAGLTQLLAYALTVGLLFGGAWLWLTLSLQEPRGQLLTVTPHNPNHLLSVASLEQLNHSPHLAYEQGQSLLTGTHQVLLSYLHPVEATATVLGVSHPVTRIGTNASLLATVDYPLLAGHFLRDQHLAERRPVAVLNQAAAFTLFGVTAPLSQLFTLDGVTYVVIGVIDDGSEADMPHLYIPITRYDTQIREILINLSLQPHHSVDYLLSLLRQVGISEESHAFTR